jgi:hypothetical protein
MAVECHRIVTLFYITPGFDSATLRP